MALGSLFGRRPLDFLEAMAPPGTRWLSEELNDFTIGDIDHALGLSDLARGAWWSATHPLARLQGDIPERFRTRDEFGREINAGMAPIGPFGGGAALFRQGFRMGPARSQAERALRVEQRRAFRKGERFIESLPTLPPAREGWRRYQLGKRSLDEMSPPRRLGRGADVAAADQRLMHVEELEDLLPQKLLDTLYESMSGKRFSRVLGEAEDLSTYRSNWTPEAFQSARARVSSEIADDITDAAAKGEIGRAARLAAAMWQYQRSPREMMDMRFGRYSGMASRTRRGQPDLHPTESASWAEMRDKALKRTFRDYMSQLRQKGRPRQGN